MKRTSRHIYCAELLTAAFIFASLTVGGQSQSKPDAGFMALSKGDYKGAEVIYRKALAQSPQSPETLSNLGIALQMQGKSGAAIHVFELALRQKPIPRTYALLAEEKCKTRDLDGARSMLARITREHFSDPSILAIIAPCYLELDEPTESVGAYTRLVTYSPYPADLALLQLAKSYRKAAQYFFGLLARAPGNTAYVDTIREARDSGSANARGAFDAAAKSSPYFRSDLDFSDAVTRWREHQQDTSLLYLLSVLSGEQSMRQVEICIDRYPNSLYLAQLNAEMLADQGHEDEAVVQYESLMRTHPELPDLLFDLGTLFRKERDWEKALDAFQRQLARYPDDERTAARVSEALIQLGRWQALSDFLSTRVAADDPPLWAMLDLAEAEQNMDQPQQAISVLASAERAYPSDKSLHYRLTRLYHITGNDAQAKKEQQMFRELSK